MFCRISVSEDWETSIGELKVGHTYAIPQEVYKNEIFGKVGHVNQGSCLSYENETPSKPALPAILDQDEHPTPKRSHKKKE